MAEDVVNWEKKYYELLERHKKFKELVFTEALALWKKIN